MINDDPSLDPVARWLWRRRASDGGWSPTVPVRALRILWLVVRDVRDGRLGLHATGLVYITLLSFVPLSAISFSVLKGFGIHNQIEPLLGGALAPLGDRAGDIAAHVIGFVDRMDVGTLGAIGVGVLVYTAIATVQKIERAFNEIWGVARPRSLARKFTDYLSVLLIAPVLMVAALGLTAALKSSVLYQWIVALPLAGAVVAAGGRLVPLGLLLGLLAFAYAFVPNTAVRARSALIGALVAALLWFAAAWGFAAFIAGAQSYTAIYQAFATLIVLLIWLDLNWLIVLVGAAVAAYHQHPERVDRDPGAAVPADRSVEVRALALTAAVARAFHDGRPPADVATLAATVGEPPDAVRATLDALEAAGVVARTADATARFLPAAAPAALPLIRVVGAVRQHPATGAPATTDPHSALAECDAAIADGIARALAGRTVEDLIAPPPTGRPTIG